MNKNELIKKGLENWVKNHKGEPLLLKYSSVVELQEWLKQLTECENIPIKCEDEIMELPKDWEDITLKHIEKKNP